MDEKGTKRWKNGALTLLNTHQMFFVHATREEFQSGNNHRSFWICVWGKLGQGNHVIIVTSSFQKVSFSKCLSSTRKRKAGAFKFLGFDERFRKTPFTWRISVDGRPNLRNKAVFSWRISVYDRPNRRKKAAFSWRISVDGRPNRRNKAAFSWRISVDGRPNSRNKAVFSWRISVDGKPNRRNKAVFSWRISVDGRPNRRNKAAFSNFSGVVWKGYKTERFQHRHPELLCETWLKIFYLFKSGVWDSITTNMELLQVFIQFLKQILEAPFSSHLSW